MILVEQNTLDVEVSQLVTLIDTVVMETIMVVDTIEEVILNITGQALPNFLDQVHTYICVCVDVHH